MSNIIKQAQKVLGGELVDNSLDISNIPLDKVKDWLADESFVESTVRIGRWFRGGKQIILDVSANLLYEPKV